MAPCDQGRTSPITSNCFGYSPTVLRISKDLEAREDSLQLPLFEVMDDLLPILEWVSVELDGFLIFLPPPVARVIDRQNFGHQETTWKEGVFHPLSDPLQLAWLQEMEDSSRQNQRLGLGVGVEAGQIRFSHLESEILRAKTQCSQGRWIPLNSRHPKTTLAQPDRQVTAASTEIQRVPPRNMINPMPEPIRRCWLLSAHDKLS